MPTAADYEAEILREVGDPNSTLTPIIGTLWSLYADRGLVSLELQALYTKRAALDIRCAEQQQVVNFTMGDVKEEVTQQFTNLANLRTECTAEIMRIEALLRARRVPVVSKLTSVEIEPAPSSAFDANDVIGSPYRRNLTRN